MNFRLIKIIFLISILINISLGQEKKKKKDITDLDEADIEKIYQQWEDNDDDKIELEDDELEPHLRKKKGLNLDIEDLKNKNLEEIKFLSKKNQPVMIFVYLTGNPTRTEGETITNIWQTSLFNANYELTRFMVEDDQAIFLINDGSKAWEIKEFLIKQERCKQVSIDNQEYNGLHANADSKKGEL